VFKDNNNIYVDFISYMSLSVIELNLNCLNCIKNVHISTFLVPVHIATFCMVYIFLYIFCFPLSYYSVISKPLTLRGLH